MNNTKDAIDRFCEIILTEKDYIEVRLADEYIEQLDDVLADLNEIREPEKNQEIRSYILNNVIRYLRIYQEKKTDGSLYMFPFSFDSGDCYVKYRAYFEEKYKKMNKNVELPEVFRFAFDYIQDVSEHYRIFLAFSETHEAETLDNIFTKISDYSKRKVEEVAKDTVDDVVKEKVDNAVEHAVQDAKISATVARNEAQKASSEAEIAAKTAVQTAVRNEMSGVTKQVSETSVTILGIFAGIVLTIVAGLFYSATVINNINSADFCKLLTVSSLVGFVCFNLLALMFRYIERIRSNGEENKTKLSKVTMFVSITLLVIMIVSGALQLSNSDNKVHSEDEKNSIHVNISTSQDEEGIDEVMEQSNESNNVENVVE